ncbi:MAG: tetratricopeptide repeat protein, partial [Shewanella sp.]
MKTKWLFIAVAFTASLSVTPAVVQAEDSFVATQKAAEQGDASAQFNLAYAYDEGEGVPQDLSQALHWYTKAA